MNKQALVIFSGGQDSTTCLCQAIAQYGQENVHTITFDYGQRHRIELDKAAWIAKDLGVKQTVIDTAVIQATTHNALLDADLDIEQTGDYPNTFVDGRNALFILLAGNYAKQHQIHDIILGVSEADYSGYPDCRDIFIKSMNVTLNLAMDYAFSLITPLMHLSKIDTWALADSLGYLDYIQAHTHTCYLGVEGGCHTCPSCQLREKSLAQYLATK